jgi:hypothetical protein
MSLVSRGRYIASQSSRPRVFVDSIFEASGLRDGLVLSEDAIDEGSSARKALSMLIVRGIW